MVLPFKLAEEIGWMIVPSFVLENIAPVYSKEKGLLTRDVEKSVFVLGSSWLRGFEEE